MSPTVAQESILPVGPDRKESMEHSSSYSSMMNGFGLWSTSHDVVKKTGSDVGTANEDEELGEEFEYKEPAPDTDTTDATADDTTSKKKKKKFGGLLKKLKKRAARAKQEKKEQYLEKLENNNANKSCLPTLMLPRRAYPVQITVLEGEEHNDYEIDDLDEDEIANATKTKAQGQRIKTLEWITEQRLKDALAHDDTESICSIDGVPILPPPEDAVNPSNKKKQSTIVGKQRDLTKSKPQFVQAPKGQSGLQAVRREVDAMLAESVVPTAARSRAVPIVSPVDDETPDSVEAPVATAKSSKWSLFSSKPKEEAKEAPQTPKRSEVVKSNDEPSTPAAPEAEEETPKRSGGWSMFSWKAKDKDGYENRAKDDEDLEEGYDDESVDDEESDEGSVNSDDDEYTRGSPSRASEAEDTRSRATRVTVVTQKE